MLSAARGNTACLCFSSAMDQELTQHKATSYAPGMLKMPHLAPFTGSKSPSQGPAFLRDEPPGGNWAVKPGSETETKPRASKGHSLLCKAGGFQSPSPGEGEAVAKRGGRGYVAPDIAPCGVS